MEDLARNPEAVQGHRWWAGISVELPRGSLSPLAGPRLLRRWNEHRLRLGRRAVFPYPTTAQETARRSAQPTSTGFGDLILAWLMPMTLARLKGWEVTIPVPWNAGGLHHDPARPQITADWVHATLSVPAHVRMVPAEATPEGEDWFCTLVQQWHLNSCMETSYETIPWWLRDSVDRMAYYETYRAIARSLLPRSRVAFPDGRPYMALNARRKDRGNPLDDGALHRIIKTLSVRSRDWVVVSDDPEAHAYWESRLTAAGCAVAESPDKLCDVPTATDEADRRRRLMAHFETLVGANSIVSSVQGGWSAFPYAATRISGAPMLFVESLRTSIVWQVIRAHSRVPIDDVFHGPEDVADFERIAVR